MGRRDPPNERIFAEQLTHMAEIDNANGGGGGSPMPPYPKPTNNLVTPLLTDLYQLTMAYAYWKTNQHKRIAHFELFFRKNPFDGSYTVFAGLDEVLRFLSNFRFTSDDIDYLRRTPH